MEVVRNHNTIPVTCKHCKSELKVTVGDIEWNEIPHRCDEFEVVCGACGRRTGVPQSSIPQAWIRAIVPDDTGH